MPISLFTNMAGEPWASTRSLHHTVNTTHTDPSNLGACLNSEKYRTFLRMKHCRPYVAHVLNSPMLTQCTKLSHKQERASNLFSHIFPVAQCSSRLNELTPATEATIASHDEDDDQLPGVSSKRSSASQSQKSWSRLHDVSALEINMWLDKETGMDRLRQAYAIGGSEIFVQEDTRILNTMLYRTALVGLFISVVMAGQNETRKKEKNLSGSEAIMKGIRSEQQLPKQIFKQALRSTLKLTAFSAVLYHLPHAIAVYRNRSSIWEYVASSVLAFGALGMGRNPQVLLSFVAAGAVTGTIGGYIVNQILASAGLTQEQRHVERVKQYILEQRSAKPPEMDEVATGI